MKKLYCALLLLFALLVPVAVATACPPSGDDLPKPVNPRLVHNLQDDLTKVISLDRFAPPAASRIYAYTNIALYEILAAFDERYVTLAGQVNELSPVPQPEAGAVYNQPLIYYNVFLDVAGQLVYNEPMLRERAAKSCAAFLPTKLPKPVEARSLAYAKELAGHIVAWSKTDRFHQRKGFPRHTVKGEPGTWEPTPPAYMSGLEPNWWRLRTFVTDTSAQIKPEPPIPFSAEKGSDFYNAALEVYELSKKVENDSTALAWHWDDNCKGTLQKGHFMMKTFKQTPIGHWIFITRAACLQNNISFDRTIEAYMYASIAMAEGMFAAWAEKYRSDLIRPITYINRYIDKEWEPVLETPYFPEHPSAHAAISAAAAAVLGDLITDNVTFIDSSIQAYKLPPRKYHSLKDAAWDAALSRLYGGIHYRHGCVEGYEQGLAIGRFVLEELETRNE